ncbi:MAG TPA: hypothetical protein VKH40_17905 [Alloacidobacterium sp.]|nr:hypothetical protein [Alloacidobacterium sp.]
MNMQSNVMPEALSQTETAATVTIPASRRMLWSVRRELWEYRSIYLAPAAVAVLFLIGFLINLFHLPGRMHAAGGSAPMQQFEMIAGPYNSASELLIMLSTFIVAIFYCLEALHGERRDRSILFWKSLPVSDLETVLSKACIPLVVLPLVTFAITVVTQFAMLMASSAMLMATGQSAAPLWAHLGPLPMWLGLLYHLVTIHSLWYAPIFCWLMMVSAWARRAPFLWALLPPLAIAIVEKIAFGTAHFGELLRDRIAGAPMPGTASAGFGPMKMPVMMLSPAGFLISPGLWVGLALSAIFLLVAVRLRRYRGPI